MLQIVKSTSYDRWITALRDRKAVARIALRIDRLASGHFGDVKPVGDGVSEMRINCGPGYRVYYTMRGKELVLLLCGGDKSTQSRDIAQAKVIASALKG